jgi:hypothetical protein
MLCIRWYANYHVIIWCEMQTGKWMSYSDFTHFLINFHIKYILFRVIIWKIWFFTRFAQILPLFRQPKTTGTLLTEVELDRGADAWDRDRWQGRDWGAAAGSGWRRRPTCQWYGQRKISQKWGPSVWFELSSADRRQRAQATMVLSQICTYLLLLFKM